MSDTLTGLSEPPAPSTEVLGQEAAPPGPGSGAPVSVILLDLDHFKAVNDQHGHPVGDRVLVTIGELLKAGSRQTDEVGRWGGEEFLVVCRDTDVAGARALAQKLREHIAAHDFGVVGHRTASFGVAQLADGEDVAGLVARADVALYRAGARGAIGSKWNSTASLAQGKLPRMDRGSNEGQTPVSSSLAFAKLSARHGGRPDRSRHRRLALQYMTVFGT